MGLTGDFSKLEELQKLLKDIESPKGRLTIAKSVAKEYQAFMEECFKAGHSPYGQAWAALRFRTSVGGAGQVPLANTTIMKNAMTPKNVTETGFQVTVSHPGARVHQYGATIVPKTAKALAFRGGIVGSVGGKVLRGTAYIRNANTGRVRRKVGGMAFFKKVVIPARPYAPLNGMPADLDSRVQEAIEEAIQILFGK